MCRIYNSWYFRQQVCHMKRIHRDLTQLNECSAVETNGVISLVLRQCYYFCPLQITVFLPAYHHHNHMLAQD